MSNLREDFELQRILASTKLLRSLPGEPVKHTILNFTQKGYHLGFDFTDAITQMDEATLERLGLEIHLEMLSRKRSPRQ